MVSGRKKKRSERGMALLVTMVMVVVVIGSVLLVSRQAVSAKIHTDTAHRQHQIEEACKAGIDHAIQKLCDQYVAQNSDKVGNYTSYRTYLDNLVPQNSTLTLATSSTPIVLDANRGVRVTNLTISRGANNINGFDFTINSTAQVQNKSRTAQQTLNVGGSPFTGFEYAVLANNISCILCHAEVRNVDLDNNTNSSLYGTFDRVKVASLMNLMFRPTSDVADSRVAGTIYTRGNVINSYTNTAMSSTDLANKQLSTYPFNATTGKITQNSSGAMGSIKALAVTGTDSKGLPLTGGNLYKNYPIDPKQMTDSILPGTFPAPYPDDNEDKIVQSAEFHQISDLLEGSATGGIAYGVPAGSTYGLTSFPTASNGAATALVATRTDDQGNVIPYGGYNGNLILTGTTANPITLNGQIFVEGDLLLRGAVKGTGQIFVKGNTYIAGDVTYADGTTFGRASDGTKNSMAVITGGNVVVGDYLTIRAKNHSKDNTSTTPSSTAMSGYSVTPAYSSGVGAGQLSIQTRVSSQTVSNVTNPARTSDTKESLQIGYNDPNVTDGNGIVTARGGNQQLSFTQSDLTIFNNLEIAKASADSNYKPRFYGMNSSAPDNIYFYDNSSSEHPIRYDEGAATAGGASNTVLNLANYIIKKGYGSKNIPARAARLFINPAGGWISDTVLRKMWWDDEQSRTTANDIFNFDGLLYCNNSIFCITRSKVRHGSNTEGKMRVRGAIICPDIGVLTAGNSSLISSGNTSFLLQYDRRVRDFWSPQDRTQVSFRRQVYELLPES